MLAKQQSIRQEVMLMKVQEPFSSLKKRLFFSFFQGIQYRRFLTIANRIASIAILDINPELYASNEDVRWDNWQQIRSGKLE